MTGAEATFKKKKNNTPSVDGRISTHPSYTEYSWDTLVASRPKPARDIKQSSAAARNTAGIPRVNTGAIPKVGTAKPGTAQPGTKSRTAEKTAARREAKAKAVAVEKAEKKARIRKKSVVAIHTIAVDKKYSFPLSIVLLALTFTILIMATVTTSVQISEITAVNANLRREYNGLLSDENELRLLLETRDDLRVVETVAKEEYGMIKKDQVERYYLTVHKEDKIEIVEEVKEETTGIFDGIMSFGGAVAKRIRNFFGF